MGCGMYLFVKHFENVRIAIYISDMLFDRADCFFPTVMQCFDMSYENSPLVNDFLFFYSEYDDEPAFLCSRCHKCNTEDSQWKYWFLYEVESWIIECLQCTVFHGSGVRVCGKNILLLGGSMSGKTTLTYHLCHRYSADYLDDDCIYMCNGHFWGFHFPMALRNPSILSVDEKEYVIGYSDDAVMKNRCLLTMPSNLCEFKKVDYILFLHYTQSDDCKLTKLSGGSLCSKMILNVRFSRNPYMLYEDIIRLIESVLGYELWDSSTEEAIELLRNNCGLFSG